MNREREGFWESLKECSGLWVARFHFGLEVCLCLVVEERVLGGDIRELILY